MFIGKRPRRKMEFSKQLAVWAILIATAAAAMSYYLALRDHQTASDVTTTIFTGCIGYLVTYAAKSATEKISRNRHGLDADGKPLSTTQPAQQSTHTDTDQGGIGI